MLEMVGAPEVWREGVEALPLPGREPVVAHQERVDKLGALAGEVRRVVENAGWRERNVYWPEGMHLVEERLEALDRTEG
jgi:hypothetical protein